MDFFTVNFTITETSTNFTTYSFGLMDSLTICVYTFGLLFGLLTHCYVIWLIITENEIASEFFFLNLSVCEIGICLNFFFFGLAIFFSGLSNLSLFLQGLAITGRPLFECLICVERYLAVVHPVTFLKFKPLRYRVICCTVAWIIILGSCLSCIPTLLLLVIEISTCFFSTQFLLFLSIQLFCCVAVLRALKQSGPGERGREREEENHMKRRAFYLILIFTMTMVITYVPYITYGLLVLLKSQIISEFRFTGLICFVFSGFVHPALYLHRAGKLSCLFTP